MSGSRSLPRSGVQAFRHSGVFRIAYFVSDKGGPAFDFAGYEIRNTHYPQRLNARSGHQSLLANGGGRRLELLAGVLTQRGDRGNTDHRDQRDQENILD